MKLSNLSASIIAGAAVALFPMGAAVADIGGQVMVQVKVESGCEVNGKDAVTGMGNDFGMLDFGVTSPTWTNSLTAQVATAGGGGLVVNCDPSVEEVAVSINGGLYGSRKLMHADGGTIDYQVYRDSARSDVFVIDKSHPYQLANSSVAIPIYGAIPPFSGSVGKNKGLYTDVMTVTLTF